MGSSPFWFACLGNAQVTLAKGPFLAIRHNLDAHVHAHELVDHVRLAVDHLVGDQAPDAHHGGAALVKLHSALPRDGLGIPLGLLEVDLLELRLARGVADVEEADEEEHLSQHTGGNVIRAEESTEARGDALSAREAIALRGNNVTCQM